MHIEKRLKDRTWHQNLRDGERKSIHESWSAMLKDSWGSGSNMSNFHNLIKLRETRTMVFNFCIKLDNPRLLFWHLNKTHFRKTTFYLISLSLLYSRIDTIRNRLSKNKSACFIKLVLKTGNDVVPCPLHKSPQSKHLFRILWQGKRKVCPIQPSFFLILNNDSHVTSCIPP